MPLPPLRGRAKPQTFPKNDGPRLCRAEGGWLILHRRAICVASITALTLVPGNAHSAAEQGAQVLKVVERHGVALRDRPGGRILAVVGDRTEFGSPRIFAIFARRADHWVGVVTPELPNGRLGWINARSSSLDLGLVSTRIEVDLSRRQLTVLDRGRVLRRMSVAIGAPASPTPVGRFAVTDKLPGAHFSASYGCCILALSGHQTKLPPGWSGGDRLAIHATNDRQDIGQRISAGCVRGLDADLRYLMHAVPLGTAVVIRS